MVLTVQIITLVVVSVWLVLSLGRADTTLLNFTPKTINQIRNSGLTNPNQINNGGLVNPSQGNSGDIENPSDSQALFQQDEPINENWNLIARYSPPYYVSMCESPKFDANGNPAFVAIRESHMRLEYVYYNGQSWQTELVKNLDPSPNNYSCGIGFYQNTPVIYYQTFKSPIYVAVRVGSHQWHHLPEISYSNYGSSPGVATKLGFFTDGRPFVLFSAFVSPSKSKLFISEWDGLQWITTNTKLDSFRADLLRETPLSVANNNNIYYLNHRGNFVMRKNNVWTIQSLIDEALEDKNVVSSATEIAPDGRVGFVYTYETPRTGSQTQHLYYATYNGNNIDYNGQIWSRSITDPRRCLGGVVLKYTPEGKPWIALADNNVDQGSGVYYVISKPESEWIMREIYQKTSSYFGTPNIFINRGIPQILMNIFNRNYLRYSIELFGK